MVKSFLKILIAVYGLSFLLVGCAPGSDIEFARRLTKQLIEGRYAARSAIDWSSLKMVGQDVGAQYSKLADKNEKMGFERAFIESFSRGFRQAEGAKFKSFSNWRILDKKDPMRKIVAADGKDKKVVLLLAIAHEGRKRKLVELQIGIPLQETKDATSTQK